MSGNRHKVKGWFLTYPQNYMNKQCLMDCLQELGAIEAVVASELHEDGSPHLHAWAKFEEGFRIAEAPEIFNLLGKSGNYQAARSWKAVQQYVKKEGDYISLNIDIESAAKKKAKRSRRILEDDIDTLIDEGIISATQLDQVKRCRTAYNEMKNQEYNHNNVRGEWFYGEPGTGKSMTARSENAGAYLKSQNKWWDGYAGQEVVIIDDFDKAGECLGHHLKIWSDRYACTGEVKGGTVNLRHKKLIVTSNYRIDEIFSDKQLIIALERRFKYKVFIKDNGAIDPLNPNFV